MEKHLGQNIFLVRFNFKGDMNAVIVSYSPYGGYVWKADADISFLQLDKFSFLLQYLRESFYELELKCSKYEVFSAEIVSFERNGGYKEPFHKVVKLGCYGYQCLQRLDKELFLQFHSEFLSSSAKDSASLNLVR